MLPNREPSLLSVETLVTGYGKKQVLNGVSLRVGRREIVALIGHNGAGKSTLLKAIFGLIPLWQGKVIYDGAQLTTSIPRQLLLSGISYVPQGNRVFTDLTVSENLEASALSLIDPKYLKERINRVLSLFPMLKTRLRDRAGYLSGGQKQMLALANALIHSPRLLLLDEPSLGLAPRLVSSVLDFIRRLCSDSGVSVLIAEQKVRNVLRIAQSAYVLKNGSVSFSGPASSLEDPNKLREVYL